jgi:alkanesulfonate monooxygenase SsuD/methylene tetrahydromethanopterin reductase-like flavin-dependent oxidoreductase (luciferase family)
VNNANGQELPGTTSAGSGAIDIGVFDHLDRGSLGLAEFYEQRLQLIEAYDRAGFRTYHVAEHHSTPLGLAPSPSVFLAAIAQRTRRLRFGPLVYILPLYHPLRLLEEICMLDQISGGRLELGVGRGISPIEVGYYSVDPAEAQARYTETLEILRNGFGARRLSHQGQFYQFKDVPIMLEPLQKPHPPLWYGVINPEGAVWTAANRVNIVSNQPSSIVRTIAARYRAEWRKAGREAERLPHIGMSRHIVVDETDAAALAAARRAYRVWRRSFLHLWLEHGRQPSMVNFPEEFDQLMEQGLGFAGSPSTVCQRLMTEIELSEVNYLVCRFAFGDLSAIESLRSVQLFSRSIQAALRRRPARQIN